MVIPVELPIFLANPNALIGYYKGNPLPVTLKEPACCVGGIWLKPIEVMGKLLKRFAEALDMYCLWMRSRFSATMRDISFCLDNSFPSSTSYSGSSTKCSKVFLNLAFPWCFIKLAGYCCLSNFCKYIASSPVILLGCDLSYRRPLFIVTCEEVGEYALWPVLSCCSIYRSS